MDRNPPVNEGDMGSVPAPGRPHVPQSNESRRAPTTELTLQSSQAATATEPVCCNY